MKSLFLSLLVTLTLPIWAQAPVDPKVQAYRDRQDQATPNSVIKWLKDGNSRFARGRSNHGGYVIDARERRNISAQGQRPLAVVLSCIDSRTTPELVFDVSVGDLFTPRVGANVINDDILGSMEIAVESGAKVIVVLGHTRCGGIAAACNGTELGHFTQLLARIRPAIDDVNHRLDADPHLNAEIGERTGANPKYVREVSHTNAKQSFRQILDRSEIIREKVARGEIQLVSALYDVESGRVTFDP